ncbi:MAG: UDP-N-acetylglucosamine--LPS N-acetylglucosamine transferase [Clostridiaceae bacterium]|jgi:processive 1,2-diacylglycerol beta-glucosyltransferase|nr:UDP-N-acetylglucosamine--LPS N-acetylglucosamine transferase [Clostridiaceae bacterium]
MKALILSVSAGGGHTGAAEAIKKYILLNEPESEIKVIDTLRYINPIIDKVVIGSYLKSLKVTPSLFGKLYDYSENDFGIATLSNKINEVMTFKLLPLIEEFSPEIIFCTHPFPIEMMSILKGKSKTGIPVISILTDYASHSFWLHPHIDAYVVSNSDMIVDMESKGISKDTIHSLGIPVNPSFYEKFNRNDTLAELDLDPSIYTILIMGGSLGMGKIAEVYEQLTLVHEQIQIIIITGNNKKLYSTLTDLSKSSFPQTRTRIIGFTDKVNKYMQASDLLLTKPGGLTITEALSCNIPLGLFSPIPGQEEKNAEFLLKHDLAINLNDIDNCHEVINNLLKSKNKLEELKKNCAKYSNPNCGDDIYNLAKSLIKNKNSIKNPI